MQSARRPLSAFGTIAVLWMLVACTPAALQYASPGPRSVAGRWAFQPGDDLQWAAPGFDDREWVRLQVPGSWRRQGFDHLTGAAWYRLRLQSPWPAGEILGLTLGKIDSTYEVYAGGRLLGGVGSLPPNPRSEYDRHRTYAIPPEARGADGSILLALRVWRDPQKISTAAGPVEGPFEVGPLASLIEREKLVEAEQLAVLILFLLVAIYHLTVRIQLGSGADYTWFGVLALLAAIYGFLRTQWKYLLLDDFLILKKVEHLVLWLIPAAVLQFLWVFFGQPRPAWLRIIQFVLVAGAVTVIVSPGIAVALALLPWLQLSVVPLLVVSFGLAVRRISAGDREARVVGLAMAVFAAAIVHDALVDRNYLVDPRLSVYGFGVLVVGMSVTLGNRFQRALRDRDSLMRDLETRVDARTRELSDAYLRMEQLALHDPLTHVLNRRAIRERAAGELARARRHQESFTIALIDIDHFKIVNDTYGHAAGDQVLAQVARLLAQAVRASDDVGRWGGEEFMVLMTGTDRGEAAAAGERLRRLVAEAPVTLADGVVQDVTVSVGVMAVEGTSAEPHDLDRIIGQADEALYRAKAEGRNTTRVSANA